MRTRTESTGSTGGERTEAPPTEPSPSETLPTGAALLPALQALSLVCLVDFGTQFLDIQHPYRHVAAAWALITAGVVGVIWLVRQRAGSVRVRAACSVAAFLLLSGPTKMGHIGYATAVLIVAVALLVVDIGVRASLVASLGNCALTLLLFTFTDGRISGQALRNAVPDVFLMLVGAILGLALSRYDAALAAQRRVIAQRDAALADARRRTALEKELLLAQERTRAAHELHDGLGHRLTRIGMSLEFAGRMRHSDPDAAWEEVAVAEDTSREAVQEIRAWVRAQSPVRPGDGGGGVAGLEAVAASFRGTGVEVRLEDELSPRHLSKAAELLVHRTVQEGLTNAFRHSRARSVTIRATVTERDILVSVTNDIPTDLRPLVPRARVGEPGGAAVGFGLGGLSEHAAELGGTVTAGRDGDAFRLSLSLPLRESTPARKAS